jgi:hypothetical protein
VCAYACEEKLRARGQREKGLVGGLGLAQPIMFCTIILQRAFTISTPTDPIYPLA